MATGVGEVGSEIWDEDGVEMGTKCFTVSSFSRDQPNSRFH